mmetsp:Transcript_45980/g.51271  ORF Transcript_45980/g.51271 Transcript_45980/m.51271 type:complete len:106 (+) Transcript_45980:193-510(+)
MAIQFLMNIDFKKNDPYIFRGKVERKTFLCMIQHKEIFPIKSNHFPTTATIKDTNFNSHSVVYYLPVADVIICFMACCLTSLEILPSIRLSSSSAICSRILRYEG